MRPIILTVNFKKMRTIDKYPLLLFCLFSLLQSCTFSTRDFKKAKELVIYSPHGGLDRYTDKATMDLLRRAKRSYNTHLWKGDIKTLVIMDNNDTVELRVSRYGGFFRNAKNNKTYVFKKRSDVEQWTDLYGLRIN